MVHMKSSIDYLLPNILFSVDIAFDVVGNDSTRCIPVDSTQFLFCKWPSL